MNITLFRKKLLYILISSLLSMVLYLATYWITGTFSELSNGYLVAWIYVFILTFLFTFIFLYISFIRKGTGEKIVEEDFKEKYPGIFKDLLSLFCKEKETFFAIIFINIISWGLISLDKLAFGKRTVSAVLLVFAPLNITGLVFPTWLNGVLSYTLGSVFVFAIYLLELVVYRKKIWHKNKKGE